MESGGVGDRRIDTPWTYHIAYIIREQRNTIWQAIMKTGTYVLFYMLAGLKDKKV